MIRNVVSVIAVGSRTEKGRTINVADPKLLEVWDDFGCVFEGEMSIELQPISCNGYAASRCHFLFSSRCLQFKSFRILDSLLGHLSFSSRSQKTINSGSVSTNCF